MRAITRSGMSCAYSTAASNSFLPAIASSSSLHNARVYGSMPLMIFGPNAGNSRRRASWWNGGSEVMGGAIPIGAGRSSSFGRSSLITTERDVKCSVSYATPATVSCVTGSHAPPKRSVCATGQSRCSVDQIGYGSPTQPGSVWSKSVAQSCTGGRVVMPAP